MKIYKTLGNCFQEDVHLAEAINYLEAYNLENGLLINFDATSLNFKWLSNKNYKARKS